jgi:hypothetical protein
VLRNKCVFFLTDIASYDLILYTAATKTTVIGPHDTGALKLWFYHFREKCMSDNRKKKRPV